MSGQQPAPSWQQGPDGQWYPYPSYPEKPGRSEGGDARRRSPFLGVLKAAPLVVKLLLAIFGGSTTIIVVVVIGNVIFPPSPGPYPPATQQQWLSDCEGLSFNTASKCQCELSYFEQHVTAPQFEQDYSSMPPGVVPPELAGAEDCPS
jgi:hypothetical protein